MHIWGRESPEGSDWRVNTTRELVIWRNRCVVTSYRPVGLLVGLLMPGLGTERTDMTPPCADAAMA